MKTLLIAYFTLLTNVYIALASCFAAPAAPGLLELVQPDGQVIPAFQRGDERRNWYATRSGYAIEFVEPPPTGRGSTGWFYVQNYNADGSANITSIPANQRAPSSIRPGLIPPSVDIDIGLSTASLTTPANILLDSSMITGEFEGSVLVILAEFTNVTGTYIEATWADLLANGVIDYFSQASLGKANLTPASESFGVADNGVIGWVDLGYKHPSPRGFEGTVHQDLAADALRAADPYINYADYDLDFDGTVSTDELAVIVVVAGYESATGPQVPAIWAHTWCWNRISPPVLDSVFIGDCDRGWSYAMFGEIHAVHQATMGVVVHELGHLIFNLPDLYDIDSSSVGIDHFGIMGFGGWGRTSAEQNLGQTPVLPSAWTRHRLGWVTDIQGVGTEQIVAAGSSQADKSNTVYKASTSNPHEYFLVEKRDETGYDAGLWQWSSFGYCGLAIWHIDDAQTSNRSDTNRWVDLEEADGNEGLAPFESDLFTASSGRGFNGDTTPSSRTKRGSFSSTSLRNISGCTSDPMSVEFTHRYAELPTQQPDLGDRAGYSVAIDDEFAAVGVRLDDTQGVVNSGSVELFRRDTTGSWNHLTTLQSTAPHSHAHFGHAVALDGNLLVVGEQWQNASGFRTGAVYVYDRTVGEGIGWGVLANMDGITASTAQAGDMVGRSVDIDDGIVIAGAPGTDAISINSGAAYIFDSNSSAQFQLVPDDGSLGDLFGSAVAIQGDYVVIGAFRADAPGSDSGAAYIFRRNVSEPDEWTLVRKLGPTDAGPGHQFGYSVAIAGDRVVVGARFATDVRGQLSGAVYIFEKDAGGLNNWGQSAKLTPSDSSAGIRFGTSVAIEENSLLVGAPYSPSLGSQAGKAYLFIQDSLTGQWQEAQHLHNELTSIRDQFGIDVAVSNSHAVIGAWLDNRPRNNSGSAYVFGF